MAALGCLLMCTFGDYLAPVLAPVLIAAHTSNNLDSDNESENKNEGCERKELLLYVVTITTSSTEVKGIK